MRTGTWLAAVGGLLLGPFAHAADGGLAPGDVLVTARHRGERAELVPLAMSVIDSAALAGLTGAYRVQDLPRAAPGLQITVPNVRLTVLTIRGLGTPSFNDGLEGSVGVFLDGVYLGRQGMSVLDLADIERVEVLRGPQGTLFGRNSSAGALSLTTRAPSATPAAEAEATLANRDTLRLRASVTGPLAGDSLAGRLSVWRSSHAGTVHNRRTGALQNGEDRAGGRLQLLSAPQNRLTVRLIADYGWQDESCCVFVPVDYGLTLADGSPRPDNLLQRAARVGYAVPAIDPGSRSTDADAPSRARVEQGGVSVQADRELGGTRLTSITAYRRWRFSPRNDTDLIGLPMVSAGVANDQRQVSQELRLAGAPGRFEPVLGAYYLHQDNRIRGRARYGPAAAPWLAAGLAGSALDGFSVSTDSHPRTSSAALFGHADWHLDARWTAGGGLRLTHERKAAGVSRRSAGGDPSQAGAPALMPQLGGTYEAHDRMADTSLSGLASLAYRPDGATLLYANLATGQKSGGISSAVVPAGASRTFRPEETRSLEVGLKTTLWNRRLALDLTGYWMRVRDYQALAADSRAPNVVFTLVNAGRVRSRGVELELRARPAAGLALTANGAFSDARYLAFRDAPCAPESVARVCDYSGRPVSNAPRWTASLQGEYRRPLGALQGFLRAGWSWRSRTYGTAEQARATLIGSYGIVDLAGGVQHADGRWEVSLWAHNLTRRTYLTGFITQSLNTVGYGAQLGEPRSWGVTLRSRF
jgi:iron complex outermembrane receptor protein